ncbi:hypothetical protein KUCAC02_032227 [Chaenocephalus aceratus]|nr:hypothetical protein KUCAC02_032227 [Chaenocephalus aceratus]
MYKVRKLPVRFGTKMLAEDRKHLAFPCGSVEVRAGAGCWCKCTTDSRAFGEKYLRFSGVLRGQELGLTAGTDFLWIPYDV